MYESLRCVALRTIKYDDRRSITTAGSRERGRVSFIIPSGNSREAQRRRALMQPLCLFEGESDIRPGRELLTIRDVKPLHVLSDLCYDPAKALVSMFISEALEHILRESPPDVMLTDFIFDSVIRLDAMRRAVGVANFPVLFLYKLGLFLGIAPDTGEWAPGRLFDMTEGRYRVSAPTHGRWLDASDSKAVVLLHRMSFAASERIGISRAVRRRMLDGIMEYYGMHHTPLNNLKSLPVVSEIF